MYNFAQAQIDLDLIPDDARRMAMPGIFNL